MATSTMVKIEATIHPSKLCAVEVLLELRPVIEEWYCEISCSGTIIRAHRTMIATGTNYKKLGMAYAFYKSTASYIPLAGF